MSYQIAAIKHEPERSWRNSTDMSFLLAYHDRSLQIDMDNDQKLMVTGLEE
jgi:hypothetical protein